MLQEVLSKIREGYGIEDICFANDELYGGKEIKDIISNLDSDWICIETIYKELVYIPMREIKWITLKVD